MVSPQIGDTRGGPLPPPPLVTLLYLTLEELVMKHCLFYPTICHALLIAQTLPSTTCTVERSLSTLQRVKTWVRANIGESDKWIMHSERTPQRNKFGHRTLHQPRDEQICFPTTETAVFIFLCMISQFDVKKHDAADLKID